MDLSSNLPIIQPRHAIQRLTALWAFSEAGLGGLLHAFKLPFTALSVGGIAVILITLMASYSDRPAKDILRSTLIVLILKAAISPHSPIMAYVAVSFQGLAGALLFCATRNITLGALALGVIAMFESSLQKLLTLTIIYGRSLWQAIDGLFHYAGRQLGIDTVGLSLSAGLILLYVSLYIIGGIIIGWLASRMVKAIREEEAVIDWTLVSSTEGNRKVVVKRQWYKKPWFRYSVMLLVLALAMFFLQGGDQSWQTAAYVIVRSLLIVTTWMLFIAPWLKKGLDRLLVRQQHRYAVEVEDALALLPVLRQVAGPVWRSQSGEGWKRVWRFLIIMIHFALIYEPQNT